MRGFLYSMVRVKTRIFFVLLLFASSTLTAQVNPPREVPMACPLPQALASFGFASAVGDVNNDGFNDLAVAAYREEVNGIPKAGRIYIFLGPDLRFGHVIPQPPPTEEARFGYSMAFGDVNGDSFADLVATARKGHPGGVYQAGRVFVLYGPDFTAYTELNEPVLEYNSAFGYDVMTGDIDNDGYDDVAIGTRLGEVNTLLDAGEVYVFFGPSLTRIAHLTEPVPEQGASFGIALGIADLDGDQYKELIVGTIGATVGGHAYAGEVHVFKGPYLNHKQIITNPSTLHPNAIFGYHIATGDINGDGLKDVQVGAPYQEAQGLYKSGMTFSFQSPSLTHYRVLEEPVPQKESHFGRALAAGDVNRDGFDDLLVAVTYADFPNAKSAGEAFLFYGPTLTEYIRLGYEPPEKLAEFGTGVIGDVDADGYGDAFIGARLGDFAGLVDAGWGIFYDFSSLAPFATFGYGTAGSWGYIPSLTGTGTMQPGTSLQLTVEEGLGQAPGSLLLGIELSYNVLSGAMIYPASLYLVQAFTLSGRAGLPGDGAWDLSLNIANDPALIGTMTFAQAVIADTGAPTGNLAATPGLKMTVQP